MNLQLNTNIALGYRSKSQIARVITEDWVKQNSFCPSCGYIRLEQFGNNQPAADFYCSKCDAQFELKSKKDSFTLKIVNGAYETMIKRINSQFNPHFFFLNYSSSDFQITNFLVIPNHYFTTSIIERRLPLNQNARRAGWIGCNILLQNIPSSGRIYLVNNKRIERRKTVLENWSKTSFLAAQNSESRGWVIELMKIVEKIDTERFKLEDIYAFESSLEKKFPKNKFIKQKIRQQLQILRDRGLIEFLGNGNYQKNLLKK
jgi:type II restriction enzyme